MRNIFKLFLLVFLVIATACSKQTNDAQPTKSQQEQSSATQLKQPLEKQRDRSPIPSQLLQTALAAMNYADANHGRWPVPYTVDPEGENGQTWRDLLAEHMSGHRGLPGCAALVDPEGLFPPPDDEHEEQLGVAYAGLEDPVTIAFVELPDPTSEQSCVTVDDFYAQLQNCPEDRTGYYVSMLDSAVYLLDKSVSLEQLRALTTIKGHEPIPIEVLKEWGR